jgi:hypothetical protein
MRGLSPLNPPKGDFKNASSFFKDIFFFVSKSILTIKTPMGGFRGLYFSIPTLA